jgi:hypothetical protein
MKVFTYYSHVPGLVDPDLIKLWEASWRRHGWETVILTEQDASAADPQMFERFKASPLMLSCPTNPVAYTLAAMLRWIPMTKVEEPCMHTDWDIINNGWTPEHAAACGPGYPATYMAGCTCPCAIYANGRGWRLLAAALEAVPHTPEFKAEDLLKDSCDQYALSVQPKSWSIIHPDRPCRNYNSDVGWQTCPLIHFPNAHTPYPRSDTIKRLGFSL